VIAHHVSKSEVARWVQAFVGLWRSSVDVRSTEKRRIHGTVHDGIRETHADAPALADHNRLAVERRRPILEMLLSEPTSTSTLAPVRLRRSCSYAASSSDRHQWSATGWVGTVPGNIIRIEQPKGGKDRNVVLPAEPLDLLRQWWKARPSRYDTQTPGPERWLFPSRKLAGKPLTTRQLNRLVHEADHRSDWRLVAHRPEHRRANGRDRVSSGCGGAPVSGRKKGGNPNLLRPEQCRIALGESAIRGEAAVRRTQPNSLRMTHRRHCG
jgi:Phage integrase family